jgi:hypothetical protein
MAVPGSPYVENGRARESIFLQNLDKEVEMNSATDKVKHIQD